MTSCCQLALAFRLLDVLAGRKNPEGLSGSILVDGGKQPKNFKCMTGYVVQVRELRYDRLRRAGKSLQLVNMIWQR